MPELGSLAETVGQLLKDRGESLAVAESSCGGLLNATLVAVPGASAYYVGGAIIYTRTAQQGLLGVPDEAMEGKRASTEEYAAMNAATISERLGTTWGLGETGASGPTGNRYGDDAGHVCIAVSGPVERSRSRSKPQIRTERATCGSSRSARAGAARGVHTGGGVSPAQLGELLPE